MLIEVSFYEKELYTVIRMYNYVVMYQLLIG